MPYPQIWDLDSLYPHPETDEFAAAFSEYEQRLSGLAIRIEQLPALTDDAAAIDAWTTYLADWSEVMGLGEELNSFVGCHAAADAANKTVRRLEAQLDALKPKQEQIVSGIEFALQKIPEAQLAEVLDRRDDLKRIAFYLRERQAQARLRLPPEQESLYADLAVDGIQAWSRMYDRISGDLRITVMERGEFVQKSPGQVQFDDPSRAIRENNFRAASKAWDTLADSCADALNHLSGTRLTRYERVAARDHLDVPLALNRMQRETLETMWSEITAFKPKLVEYLERKAKLLGIERMSWFDQTAPLPDKYLGREETKITYDAACDTIVDSFSKFSPDFGEFAKMAIENAWIEAEERSGKRQGGFCTGFALHKQSRIFMTYNNTADNMSTLAHELGHAYHSWVLRDEPLLLQEYPMNLAETASTFAEAVLGEQRLAVASPEGQLGILDGMLGDAVAFLMNIHARFLFEDRFHRERPDGELSPERFSELMSEAQREAYCNAFADDGWYPGFWISKLHFYISGWPFYNFPYTFGYLLSLGTFALAAEYGDEFPARYRQLLINTGCMNAEQAVHQTFGLDLTAPDFWRRSLKIVGDRVDQFLNLTASL